MKPEFCKFEESVSAALASGEWSEELSQHVAVCDQCADLHLVAHFLASALPPTEEAQPLPAAGLLWWRAQLTLRQEQRMRAVASIGIMQKLSVAAGVIATVVAEGLWKPVDFGILLIGVGLLVATFAVLYSWARGRI
jgi:hypothetical protein